MMYYEPMVAYPGGRLIAKLVIARLTLGDVADSKSQPHVASVQRVRRMRFLFAGAVANPHARSVAGGLALMFLVVSCATRGLAAPVSTAEDSCFLEAQFPRDSAASLRAWEAIARAYSAILSEDPRVGSAAIDSTGFGRLKVAMAADCTTASGFWRKHLSGLAQEAADRRVRSELTRMSRSLREISREQFETVLPAGAKRALSP